MRSTEATAAAELAVLNRHRRQRINSALLRRMAAAALAEEPLAARSLASERHELCVVLVGEPEITELNSRWLGYEDATDVITFDHRNPGGASGPETPLHGDVVISLDAARSAARRFRTSWQAETVRYLLHGLLHLRGFDDQTPSSRRRMRHAEDMLLKQLSRRFDLRGLGSCAGVRRFMR